MGHPSKTYEQCQIFPRGILAKSKWKCYFFFKFLCVPHPLNVLHFFWEGWGEGGVRHSHTLPGAKPGKKLCRRRINENDVPSLKYGSFLCSFVCFWGLSVGKLSAAPLAMMIYVVARALIWFVLCALCNVLCVSCATWRPEPSSDYATNMPRILSALLLLDLVGRHSAGNIWDVEWPTDMIMAANMVNGRQPMLPANRDPTTLCINCYSWWLLGICSTNRCECNCTLQKNQIPIQKLLLLVYKLQL